VVVDALGNPLALSLTGGQVHDITQAEKLCAEVQPEALLADKGYDADGFITSLEVLYAERNLVERFFQYLKQFRAIATRYEKTARNFLAGLHLVCALAWLK
jgi:transposase